MELVFDIESNGLRGEATKLWCIAAVELKSDRKWAFGPEDISDGLDLLGAATKLIGHNIVGFDLPLLNDLFGKTYTAKVVDTLIISKLFNHYRQMPVGCPPTYKVELPDGKVVSRRVGPHSLQAWAVRLGGETKVAVSDWYKYDPLMLVRCASDVRITEKVYYELLREGGYG